MAFKYTSDKADFKKVKEAANPIAPSNPKSEAAKKFSSLGDSFMLQNEYRKAVKEYLVSLMVDKNNIYAYKGASKAYKNLKEYDKAIKHLKNARNIYGFDSEIYYELGLNYLLNDDNLNAQKNFIRTLKLSPGNKNAQVKLALTHELSGEDDMAILVYNTIIEKYPCYIPALSSLAGLHMGKDDFKTAITLFRRMLKINPEYYRAYLGLGLCFDKLEKFTVAIRFYKKYISLKPNSSTAKSLIGRIYEIHNIMKTKAKNPKKKNFRVITR